MQSRRDMLRMSAAGIGAGVLGLASEARAQAPSWLVPDLLAAAKGEGGKIVVYSAINEQEALPLWKVFEEATGIRLEYVRGSDAQLASRVAIEARGGANTWDIYMSSGLDKMPLDQLAAVDPPQAKGILAEARHKSGKRFGVHATHNAPAFNTKLVKREELPRTYEEFATKTQWAGKIAIDAFDQQWYYGLTRHFGDERAKKILTEIVAATKPVVTEGHLNLARQVGAGEYLVALNNYLSLTLNVKLKNEPTDFFLLDPVVLVFIEAGVNARAPHPRTAALGLNFLLSREFQELTVKSGRTPVRRDVGTYPPDLYAQLDKHKVQTIEFDANEDKKYLKIYTDIMKGRT
jgi:iron(III) transport system substrate-binding protein